MTIFPPPSVRYAQKRAPAPTRFARPHCPRSPRARMGVHQFAALKNAPPRQPASLVHASRTAQNPVARRLAALRTEPLGAQGQSRPARTCGHRRGPPHPVSSPRPGPLAAQGAPRRPVFEQERRWPRAARRLAPLKGQAPADANAPARWRAAQRASSAAQPRDLPLHGAAPPKRHPAPFRGPRSGPSRTPARRSVARAMHPRGLRKKSVLRNAIQNAGHGPWARPSVPPRVTFRVSAFIHGPGASGAGAPGPCGPHGPRQRR